MIIKIKFLKFWVFNFKYTFYIFYLSHFKDMNKSIDKYNGPRENKIRSFFTISDPNF